MKKTFRLVVASVFLFSVTPALSQNGQGGGENSSTTTTQSTDRDDDTDWGWIGLAGLLGLLGLRKKDHPHDDAPGRVTR
jgi:MYXO-CTERM domain-containing protein